MRRACKAVDEELRRNVVLPVGLFSVRYPSTIGSYLSIDLCICIFCCRRYLHSCWKTVLRAGIVILAFAGSVGSQGRRVTHRD